MLLIFFTSAFTSFHRSQLVELAIDYRLPTMCGGANWSDVGCFMSYGPNVIRVIQTRRRFCGQNLERNEARRHSNRTTDKVRVDCELKNGEADRLNDSAERAGESEQGDPVISSTGRQTSESKLVNASASPFAFYFWHFMCPGPCTIPCKDLTRRVPLIDRRCSQSRTLRGSVPAWIARS